MRDYNRKFRTGIGDRPHDDLPHVVNTFKVDADEDWCVTSHVDDNGWVDIPVPTEADIGSGRLISVRVPGRDGFAIRLLDKERYNMLVDRLESPDAFEKETGTRDKCEFFCSVDAVEYHSDGKVRLSHSHLYTLKTEKKVELRAVEGGLEIHKPR